MLMRTAPAATLDGGAPAIPNVILADDHALIRYGMKMALESSGLARVTGEAGGPAELFRLLAQADCDVVVTDFAMPDEENRDGLSLIDRLARLHPDIPVIVITALRNAGLLKTLLDLGVKGLVAKGGGVNELMLAFQAVSKGRDYVCAPLRQLLLEASVAPKVHAALTRAEIEVLRLFANDGLTSKQISERLNRSRKTISRHKCSALAKLGLSTDQELLDYCRQVDLSAV
jgi:two-component system capsular synthesis response regulator RcsB